ncbi:MAG: peptide chain release factor N(5)-glutamine methyltransferase [Planctomycetota bacterium]
MKRIHEALGWAARGLKSRGIDQPRLDAELLLAHALGVDRAGLILCLEGRLEPEVRRDFLRLLRKRRARVPVPYLTGRRAFHELILAVGPGVLVPRPETELLVEAALERLQPCLGSPLVLDVGTGSGNIALAIAAQVRQVRVVAIDLSMEALAFASRNVRNYRLDGRVHLVQADLAMFHRAARPSCFDLIVSNPPYVEERVTPLVDELAHEPALALVGGCGPFPQVYRLLIRAAGVLLRPGGTLMMEVGIHQAGVVRDLIAADGSLGESVVLRDLAGIERVVICRHQGDPGVESEEA